MVDVVSIVIAVVSMVGALLSASITGWFAYFSEERARLSESEKLVAKYRDPLLLATYDLQNRLYNILDGGFLSYYDASGAAQDEDRDDNDNVLHYTCFLVGQYFSWTYILRRQVQFLRFSTDKDNTRLASVLNRIQEAFSTDRHGHSSEPFMLWRGHQMAIGEIMTVKEDTELYCIGYAAFSQQWAESKVFRGWFRPIASDIKVLARASRAEREGSIPDFRLRRLQHLLLDLVQVLDPHGRRAQGPVSKHCLAARKCPCADCTRQPVNTTRPKNGRQESQV